MPRCLAAMIVIALRLAPARTAAFATRASPASGGRSVARHVGTASATKTTTGEPLPPSASTNDRQVVQDMLYRIRQVNRLPEHVRDSLLEFRVDGTALGKVSENTASMLCNTDCNGPPVFEIRRPDPSSLSKRHNNNNNNNNFNNDNNNDNDNDGRPYLTLSAAAGRTVESRTEAVHAVMSKLRDDGVVTGWRNETYPVSDSFYSPPVLHCERSAITLLGAPEYGVHINGLVQTNALDEPRMWIARRSRTKSKFPGMLDHVVAGGQPSGLGLFENVVKECGEEAGIPQDLARAGLKAAGAISYETYDERKERLTRCVLFNFDLYLPESFVPTPVDGEAEEFFLWTIDQIKESMAKDYHDPIKPNCYVVIIDYLIRTGFVSPEAPGYLDVVRELRNGVCV